MSLAQYDDWSPNWATHPGEHLEEHLEVRGWSQADFVRLSGLSKKLTSEIISGKNPVTPETAIVLERVLGLRAYIWTGLQADYDLFVARRRKSEPEPQALQWMKRFPIKELRSAKVIDDSEDEAQTLDSLLRFLGIGTWTACEAKLCSLHVQHRQAKGDASADHVFAWLMLGEHRIRSMDLPPFDEGRFSDAVNQIKSLTRAKPAVFEPVMKELCRSAGVAIVFAPGIGKTKLYGSARWIDANRAVIQMSLRMKSNDHFWWTFFHECAHVLLHRGKNFADDAPGNGDELEREANDWAKELLVGRDRFQDFAATHPRSKQRIVEFADNAGVHAGIVVGMLQHVGVVPHSHMNDLKERFELT